MGVIKWLRVVSGALARHQGTYGLDEHAFGVPLAIIADSLWGSGVNGA